MAGGSVAVLVGSVVGLVAMGQAYSYSAVPLAAYLLPAAAAPMLWLGEVGLVRDRRPWLRSLIRLTLSAAPVGVAVALAASRVETDIYY
jgi:hypothetical protein